MTKRSKILILGGSKEQLPIIELSKKIGYYVIVLDNNESCIGRSKADKYYNVSIKDKKKVFDICENENVISITSLISEAGINTMYCCATRMKLPNIYSKKSVAATIDKVKMREILSDNNINDVAYVFPKSYCDVKDFIEEVGCPVVLKSSTSGGQNGLFKIDNPGDAESFFNSSKADTSDGKIILEQFIEGSEVNCVFTVYKGELKDLIISDRICDRESFGVVKRHVYPSRFSLEVKEKIKQKCLKYIEVLDINYGVVFPQFMISKGLKPHLIEIGVRVPGGIMEQLFKAAVGFDLTRYYFDITTGNIKDYSSYFENKGHPNVIVTFLTSNPGPLKIGKVNKLKMGFQCTDEGVFSHGFYGQEPYIINPLKKGRDRFYYIVTVGETYSKANEVSKSFFETLNLMSFDNQSLINKQFDFNRFYNEY